MPKLDLKQYTQGWLKDGRSKHPGEIKYVPGMEFKAQDSADGSIIIEGYASTNAVDWYDEIVEPTAFESSIYQYLSNPILLLMHDWWSIPIGKVLDAVIKEDGLWIKAKILPTQFSGGADTIMLVKEGILKAFSIGFRTKKLQKDEETGITTITDLQLMEISVVHTPANPFALFSESKNQKVQLKSLMLDTTPEGEENVEKETKKMDLDNKEPKKVEVKTADSTRLLALERKVDDFLSPLQDIPSAVEKTDASVEKMKTTQTELMALVNLTKEKADQLSKDRITLSEFNQFRLAVEADLKSITDTLAEGKLASSRLKAVNYRDWMSLAKPEDFVYLKNERGEPLDMLQQKAYHYFCASVDYKSSPNGEFLKKIRDLHDVALLTYQYYRGLKGGYYKPQNLKAYRLLHDAIEPYDPEFAKAMYSTGSGVGDEWVPTLMSSELMDLMTLQPGLANYIPTFQMPSQPFDWPIKTARSTAYLASEASVNNPSELHKSNMTTSKITFSTDVHAVCIGCSPELIEDAIVEMVGTIRQDIAYALNEGLENALINGDTTATHRDTAVVTGTDDIARAFMGLRFIAIDKSATFDTQSTSVGDATTAFAAKDVRYCRQLLGSRGKNPRECLYVTSISPFFYILSMSEFAKANEFGYSSTWYTGELPILDGSELYVTSQLSETLAATGLGTSASTYKGILCLNKNAFKIGERRGITVEFEKNILTQQWNFVASRRVDFQDMLPSSQNGVSFGYKIA
jgi:HK97 family phage prohead protease